MDFPQKSFEQFAEGDLNSSLQTLQKLRSQCQKEESGKIIHNITIVEYFLQNCQHPTHLLSKLDEIQQQNFIKEVSQNEEEIDLVAGAICAYNRAILQYQLQNYQEAIQILESLHAHLEPLDEFLTLRICILLLECYVLTKNVQQASAVLAALEKMEISMLRDSPYEEQMPSLLLSNGLKTHGQPPNCHSQNEFKFLICLYKARIAFINNNVQEAKNYIKSITEIKANYALKLQPQIESLAIAMTWYFKGLIALEKNKFAKAIQILNKCQEQSLYILDSQTHASCKPCKSPKISMPIFHYNNLACVHMKMEKFSLAQMYLKEALKYCQIQEGEEVRKENSPVHIITYYTYMRKYQVLYNNAITLLKLGEAEQALQYFLQIKDHFKNDFMLWYRMAQCCVLIHHSKLISKSQQSDCFEEMKINVVILPQRSNFKMNDNRNLILGVKCVRHAISQIDEQIVKYNLQISAFTNQQQEVQQQDQGILKEMQDQLQFYNVKKVDCLLLLSFICLCKNDEPHCALQASTCVLNMPQDQASSQQRYIATMYAVEALCIIGKYHQALDYLQNINLSQELKISSRTTCFPSSCKIYGQVSKQFNSFKYAPENEISFKMLQNLNLASVFIMNDNLQQAQIALQNALNLLERQSSQHTAQTQQGMQYQ